jgi:putative ABC transport system permease protein
MNYYLYSNAGIRAVGGIDKPNGLAIYTDNFEAKENILAHLDEWNDTHDKAQQVRYTDTVGTMMSMVQTILNAVTYVLVAFTAISLVVSSVMIGIINYVSVVERVKEIGVLRSLGARKRDIKNLFNAETFIIGLASGLIGVGVSYLIAFVVNLILLGLTGIPSLASLPVTSAVIMVVISVVLTLISGLIPANAAAKKDPVVALRSE